MRPPSVFVRALAPVEGQRLKRLSRRAKHASTRQRAMIVPASQTLMSPHEIALMLMSDESHVRKVIHDFNERGFDSLRPRFGGGRPRRISSEDEQRIVALAGARPDSLGVPTRAGAWPSSPATCEGRGSPSPPPSSDACSNGPGSLSSAREAGSGAPIPTTRRRRSGSSPSTASDPQTAS